MEQSVEEMYEILFNKEDRAMMLLQRRQVIVTSSSDESGKSVVNSHVISRSIFDQDNHTDREKFRGKLRKLLKSYQRELKAKERRVLYGVTKRHMSIAEVQEEMREQKKKLTNAKDQLK